MDKSFKSLSNKKIRYGSFSTLMVIVVIAILLVVNLVFGQLNLSMDLTKDKIYSITDQTRDALKDIDRPVTIYALFKTGDTSYFTDIYRELLSEYPTVNRNISLEYMDPYLYPQFIQQYAKEGEEIANGSIIVVCEDKFKVIPQSQLVTMGYDTETYTQYVQSVDIESKVTNSIRYVVSGESSIICHVTNHNEVALESELVLQLGYENFEIREIDLLMEGIPEDCDLLLVTTPGKDWSEAEADIAREYFQADGHGAFFVDMSSTELTNLYGVLESYGVTFSNQSVIEENYQNMYAYLGSPLFIMPNLKSHDITDILISRDYRALLYNTMPIEQLSLKKNSTTIETVMASSANSYSKGASTTVGKEPNDPTGPFDVAVAITDSFYTDKQHTSKIFVMGTSSILSVDLDSYVTGNNLNFVINGLKWTQDNTQEIYVRPKTTTASYSVNMSYNQAMLIMVFSIVVLPVALLATGIIVWLRRRNS